ncbi:MAG: DUF1819 family protein [Anaerolineales bacterium]|jgi:hypothetical protein
MASVNKYKLSFTAAGLSLPESVKIAEVYLNIKDWEKARKVIFEQNLLQSRTGSRTVRVFRELTQRLELLSEPQLELLVEGNLQEQKYLLWFAVCKTYKIIEEFAIEVLHDKFMSLNLQLTEFDYDAFFNRKADWNDDLETITSSTRIKLRTVVFRMLKEAGLTSGDNLIIQAMLSKRVVEVLKPNAPTSYQIFPLRLTDVEG